MLSSRRDFDDLETSISLLIEKQETIEGLVKPLSAEMRREFSEELKLTESTLQDNLQTHFGWLESALKGLFHEIKQRHEEVANSLETLATQNREQAERQNAMAGQLRVLEEHSQRLAAQLEEHRDEWRSSQDYELQDETAQALNDWCDHVASELAEFQSGEGMARLFADRLQKHMGTLRGLLKKLASAPDGLEAKLEELQRVVFTPDLGVSWGNLTPPNSTPAQRRQLHRLENAVDELRAHVRQELRRTTGIAMLEIVLGETRFDARLHESSDFLEVPTSDAGRHNVIVAVERPGYQKFAPDGSFTLLQSARVRRMVLSPKSENALEISETNANVGNSPDAEASAQSVPENKNDVQSAPDADASAQSAPEAEAGTPSEKEESVRRVTGQL